MWKLGDCVTWRNIAGGRVWSAIPAIVVKDSPEEVALAVLPGAECMAPEDYSKGKQNGKRRWDFKDRPWKLDNHIWHTSRLLFLLEPQKYYSIAYFWKQAINQFECYYINFQLPFCRSHSGFDTLDLELDMVIEPDFSWQWKDLDEYQKGIDSGIILKEWVTEIECARIEVLERLAQRKYPFDNSWLDWCPDPSWSPPKLPADWDKV
jgi:hypothetical protein